MNNSKILKLNSVAKNVLKNYIEASKSSEMGVARVEIIPIQEIQLVENNPNKHSGEHLDDLASSINKYGLMVPVLKNSKNQLITGEGRYRSLLKLGSSHIACLTIENLSLEILRAYRIADNQLTRSSEFDFSKLQTEFKFLYDFKIFGTDIGFTSLQVDKIYNYKIEEPKTSKKSSPKEEACDWIADKIPQRVNKGDLWRLGDNFLYCGNSLEEAPYKILMQGELANIVVTDPPYNVKISGHVCGLGRTKHPEFDMASGEMTDEEFEKNFVTPYMQNCIKNSIDGSLHYHFIDWRHLKTFLNVGQSLYNELKNICVWVKSNGGGMGSLYRSSHEMVCLFKHGTQPHINNIELGKHGRNRCNVWSYPGVRANTPDTLELLKLHPTVKPVSLLYDIFLDTSNVNDIVLDCFGGSGSTLIAATRCKRRARVIEISPHYCDIILWRWEQETGKKATLVKNMEEQVNG